MQVSNVKLKARQQTLAKAKAKAKAVLGHWVWGDWQQYISNSENHYAIDIVILSRIGNRLCIHGSACSLTDTVTIMTGKLDNY